MGRLELPLPDIGKGKSSLESAAKEMQARIRNDMPEEFRGSVVVKAFRKGGRTGLAIEYDDRAENLVYTAIEYPGRGGKK
jgi:hypothetical protein